MKELLVSFIMINLILISLCQVKRNTMEFETVTLKDVQGLFGGQNIFIDRQGKVFVQIVKPGNFEKRYSLKLTAAEVAELNGLLEKNSFSTIQVELRPGRPDEARPTISVLSANGQEKTAAKWAGQQHPQFDPIYQHLLTIAGRAEQSEPIYQGQYDPAWRPPQ